MIEYNKGVYAYVGAEGIWKMSVLSSQIYCDSKTLRNNL